jgi:hypothetical protein
MSEIHSLSDCIGVLLKETRKRRDEVVRGAVSKLYVDFHLLHMSDVDLLNFPRVDALRKVINIY